MAARFTGAAAALMNSLNTFHDRVNAVVIGASGGIGAAFVDHLAADPRVHIVHALSRSPLPYECHKVRAGKLNLLDARSIERAAATVSEAASIDLVIVASGVLHNNRGIAPEKSFRDFNADSFAHMFAVNTTGPALVAKYFLPKMSKHRKSVFSALSARVGSIGDNRLGGWAAYRMSKSALNMLVRTVAIEQSRRCPNSIVVALHPGTVDTSLSRPFTARLAPEKLFSPVDCAARLLRVINDLCAEQTGGFFAYDGTSVDY